MGKSTIGALLPGPPTAQDASVAPVRRVTSRPWLQRALVTVTTCMAIHIVLTSFGFLSRHDHSASSPQAKFQKCSIDALLGTGLPFLETAAPLPLEEFVQRRDNLAKALVADGVDAFVVEPGYTFSYYANVTQPMWEVWEPEERPFLMVVRPEISESDGSIRANTTFLVPSFEDVRARLLNMPFAEPEIQTIRWEEHWDPYVTLWKDPMWGEKLSPRLMVDEEMRDFIQRGLSENGFDVVGLNGAAAAVRQTKSPREIGILRAVNTGTVEAVRAMRSCLYAGVTENEVTAVLDNTLRAAGLEPFFDIVLFDENAALPHGGATGEKPLQEDAFVLIDVGAHLYGYSSDICRTFFPPFFKKPKNMSPLLSEKIEVWELVREAQRQSIAAMKPEATAAAVDIAARTVIENGGYGDYFTHRVGHGIGIKAHESPYLNKGNHGTLLKAGMAFTSEPGVYIWNKFGVRHEDVLLVTEDGEPDVLSGIMASGPWDP